MFLTDIFCSKVYLKDKDGNFIAQPLKFNISITKLSHTTKIFSKEVELKGGDSHSLIKLDQPLLIEANWLYEITMNSPRFWVDYYAQKTNLSTSILSEGIQISFLQESDCANTHSLISRMIFKRIDEN